MNPISSLDSGMRFPLDASWETASQSERGFRDALSAWAAIGKASAGLCVAVAFSLRPRPAQSSILRGWGGINFDGLKPGHDARSASHLYLAEALRGESAVCCSQIRTGLGQPAGVLARSTSLRVFFLARALHRVRFSAVSVSNKKAVRHFSTCLSWWRPGVELRSTKAPRLASPSSVAGLVSDALRRTRRNVLTGSV